MSQSQNSTERSPFDIALPDEIPAPPRFKTDPKSLLSGTVETLISQNDDLTARLAVSHRRNGDLERRIREMNCEYNELRKKVEILSDQILVYREKDKVIGQRHSSLEKTIRELQAQLELQNMRYAELYNSTRMNQSQLFAENQELKKQVGLLTRYRERILTRVAPILHKQREKRQRYR